MKPLRKPYLHLPPLALGYTAALILTSLSGANAAYPDLILSDHPVAYYRLEETSGSTAADSSGNGFTAYYTGTPLLGQPGIDTNSISLLGDGSFVQAGYFPDFNPSGPFTIELWARPVSAPTGGNYRCPIGNFGGWGSNGGSGSGWYIYQTPNTPSTFAFIIQGTAVWINYTYTLFDWYHLVGTFDGVNGTFYVNGVPLGSASGGGYVPNPANALGIGQRGDGYGFFDGNLDEVAIYTNALSAAKILAHYQLGTNSFRSPPTPPSIRQDPISATQYAGQGVQFTVVADGTPTLAYQWYRANTAISGATGTALSFACSTADNGVSYDVVVTNNYGSATSAAAILTVSTSLQVDAQPTSITRNVGSAAAFQVVAEGAAPISYQWYNGTTAIPGATSQTLWLPSVQASDNNSSFYAQVSNPYTAVQSDSATLSVQPRPVNVTTSDAYAQVVLSDQPIAYWRLDELSGAVTATDAVGSFDGTYDTAAAGAQLTYGAATGVPHTGTDAAVSVAGGARVSIPYAIELNPWGPFSVEGWFQPASTAANPNDYRTALSSMVDPGGNGPTGWLLYQEAGNNWSWWPYAGWWTSASLTDTQDVIQANQWYYIVLSYDGTVFTLYVNGTAQASAPYSAFVQNGNIPSGGAGSYGYNYQPHGGGAMNLGWRSDNGFNGFAGTMDEVAVYNQALTPQQIQNHYLATVRLTVGRSGSNIVLSWPVGTLQQADLLTGAWSNMTGISSPYTNSPSLEKKFYRVKVQ